MACFLVTGLHSALLPESCCKEGPKKLLLVLLAPNGVCDTLFPEFGVYGRRMGMAALSRLAVATRGFSHP